MRNTKYSHKLPSAAMAHLDELLDEASKETFPASDAIAIDIELEADAEERGLAPRSPHSAQEQGEAGGTSAREIN